MLKAGAGNIVLFKGSNSNLPLANFLFKGF
ncbi:hypothetical protein M918_07655 [Clostridium sp. BL8]|nr:hypothetical protein M918_07655 [Clostridium sp. BL8]